MRRRASRLALGPRPGASAGAGHAASSGIPIAAEQEGRPQGLRGEQPADGEPDEPAHEHRDLRRAARPREYCFPVEGVVGWSDLPVGGRDDVDADIGNRAREREHELRRAVAQRDRAHAAGRE